MELTIVTPTRMLLVLLAIVTLASSSVIRNPIEDDYQSAYVFGSNFYRPPLKKSQDWEQEKDCSIHKVDQLHLIMDRVCEMCHEMYSHENSNLRAECRQDCFDNVEFRKCIKVFSETSKSGEKPGYKHFF